MDLSYVIAELRSEMQSLDEVILSLEKLAEIRRRRTSGESETPASNGSEKSIRHAKRAGAGAEQGQTKS